MTEKKKKKGKKIMWIALITIGVLGIMITGGIAISAPGRNEVKQLTIKDVNFNQLNDGTYVGEYIGSKDHTRDTKVQVTLSSNQITDIEILKGALGKDGKPAKLTGNKSIEDLFDSVIEAESLQVDVISGATLTSKTHLKALENALEKAQTK